jgi:Arc/MetJ-type ribon-helix-helix transcriptional regulator
MTDSKDELVEGLPPSLETLIAASVAKGNFRSRTELIRAAISTFFDVQKRHEALRAELEPFFLEPSR